MQQFTKKLLSLVFSQQKSKDFGSKVFAFANAFSEKKAEQV